MSFRFCIFVIFSCAFFSCRKDKGLVNYGNYPTDVGQIISRKCATSGCHNSQSYFAAAGLDLSSWENLFNGSSSGSPVIPYRKDFSSLCYFINTYSDLGIINSPTMPLNKEALSREEVTTIYNWIENGAPDVNGNVKWADDPKRKKVYVTNQGCDVVTVFDADTRLPIRFITVGANPNAIEVPHIVRVSPDGQYWYVVFVATNIIQKFRCSDDSFVGQCTLGANYDWNTLTISADSKRAYCVAWTSNGHVASVDIEHMVLRYNVPGFNYPHGIALNETNDTIYVTANTGNFVYKIDTGFTFVDQISLEPGFPASNISKLDAHEIMISPDKKSFYVTCQKTNDVRVLDIATRTITAIIPTGYYPQELSICYSLNKLYVSCPYDTTSQVGKQGSVTEINLSNYTAKPPLLVGYMPHGIGVDEKNKMLFVASRNLYSTGPAPHHSSVCGGRNGFVNFIDLTTFTILSKRVEISSDPYGLGVRN
jgi:YVTN family beta-propeller protein